MTDYDYHYVKTSASDEWKTATYKLEEFTQDGWGEPKDLNYAAITKMAWEVLGWAKSNEQPSKDFLYIDDLQCVNIVTSIKGARLVSSTIRIGVQGNDLSVNLDKSFEMDTLAYEERFFNTYPVSPSLHYEFVSGMRDKWFSTDGYALNADLGLQSIGFDLGRADFIPIYWKGELDAYYAVSPRNFATFIFGAAGGFEQYHEEGYGYVYPQDFEYAVVGNCYRLQPQATPWSTEWYNSSLASHHYGLLRMSAALHYDGNGLWLFGAYVRDFESNPLVALGDNKIVLEPTFRLKYRSINVLLGMSRIVDFDTAGDLNKFKDYKYFVRIGNYNLF